MHDGDDGPLTFDGKPVDCATCPEQARAAAGRCRVGEACVADRLSRRIGRFFADNP